MRYKLAKIKWVQANLKASSIVGSTSPPPFSATPPPTNSFSRPPSSSPVKTIYNYTSSSSREESPYNTPTSSTSSTTKKIHTHPPSAPSRITFESGYIPSTQDSHSPTGLSKHTNTASARLYSRALTAWSSIMVFSGWMRRRCSSTLEITFKIKKQLKYGYMSTNPNPPQKISRNSKWSNPSPNYSHGSPKISIASTSTSITSTHSSSSDSIISSSSTSSASI